MKLDTIRVYAISKLSWIKKQQAKLQVQEKETPREYLDRESHYVRGRRYLLKIVEAAQTPNVELKHNHMFLTVRTDFGREKKEALVASWYREQLRIAILPLMAKWKFRLGVKPTVSLSNG